MKLRGKKLQGDIPRKASSVPVHMQKSKVFCLRHLVLCHPIQEIHGSTMQLPPCLYFHLQRKKGHIGRVERYTL